MGPPGPLSSRSGSRYSMSRTYGPRDIISSLSLKVGDNTYLMFFSIHNKSLWLRHEHVFFQVSIQESSLHIHLMNFPSILCCQGKYSTDGSLFCCGGGDYPHIQHLIYVQILFPQAFLCSFQVIHLIYTCS
jgi:hypothetical protein